MPCTAITSSTTKRTNDFSQTLQRSQIGRQPQRYFADTESRIARAYTDISRGNEIHAGTDTRSMNNGNNGLWTFFQRTYGSLPARNQSTKRKRSPSNLRLCVAHQRFRHWQ
jgi:hypothetical protein